MEGRSDRDVERAVERYGDMLLRICCVMLGSRAAGFVNGVVIPVDGGFSAYSGV